MEYKITTKGKLLMVIFAVLAVSGISMISALATEMGNHLAQAQLDIHEQKSYVTDVNVHFKTACISVIVFTYCW